jgi:chemotaxis signal transduction protein
MLYSLFHVDKTLMAVPITTILEIVRPSMFYSISGSPEVIDGLINFRGKVVTVINTGLAFGGNKVETTEESRVYIFKKNSELKVADGTGLDSELSPDNIGLHVDNIENVINIEIDELQAVPANMAHPFYKFVVRKGDDFIIILRPAEILNLNKDRDLLS